MSKNRQNWWKLVKIGNIDRESLHIWWTSLGILMKFSLKNVAYDNIKSDKYTHKHTHIHTHTHTHTHTKKQDLTLSLENKLFEPPHPPMFLRLKLF